MDEKTVYDGKFVKIKEQQIENNVWEKIYLHGGIVVYPFNSKGELLLVKELRPHETPKLRLKPVTGIFEDEYTVFENANREMQEEIGFKAKDFEIILETKSSGTINNFQYFVKATNLEKSKIPNPDGEESIQEILEVSYDDIIKRLLSGEIAYRNSYLGLMHMALKEKYKI